MYFSNHLFRYYGSVRLGTTPLHFAVFSRQISFVKLILEQLCKSDMERLDVLWDQDNSGNMVLHIAVMAGSIEIYEYLRTSFLHLESMLLKAKATGGRVLKSIQTDLHTKNALNFTPLELAAVLGKHDMLSHMINTDVVTIWEYNDFSLKGFAMRDIDTFKTLALDRWRLAQQVHAAPTASLQLCAHTTSVTRHPSHDIRDGAVALHRAVMFLFRRLEKCGTRSGCSTARGWASCSTRRTSGCTVRWRCSCRRATSNAMSWRSFSSENMSNFVTSLGLYI